MSRIGGRAVRLLIALSLFAMAHGCGTTDSPGAGGMSGSGGGVTFPTDHLVALYELDGQGGEGTHGYDGTVTGTVFPTTDRVGNIGWALGFTGADGEAVTVATEAPFDLTTFTITAFIRPMASPTDRAIVAKAPPDSYGNYTLYVAGDGGALSGRLAWAHAAAAGGTFTAVGSLGPVPRYPDAYVHVAVTMDPTSLRFYVDGVLQMSYADPPAPALNDAPFTIGRGAYGGFVGAIDSVRVYDRVLTPEEIALIYRPF